MFDEMSRRTLPADHSVSWTRGGFVYYTSHGRGEGIPQFWRVRRARFFGRGCSWTRTSSPRGSDYFALGSARAEPGRAAAGLLGRPATATRSTRCGSATCATGTGPAPTCVARTYYGGAWSADSASFFYMVHDDAYRPHQVWRHQLGTDRRRDVLVLQEDDERYELTARRAGRGRTSSSTSFSQGQHRGLAGADRRPDGAARVWSSRARPGVEYRVAHAPRPDGDRLLIVTNDGAPEFRLMRAPVGDARPRALGGAGRRGPGRSAC